MTYLSLLKKLEMLFNIITNFKVVLVFASLMNILMIIYAFKKISRKRYTCLMVILFILLFGISIVSNYNILIDTFDNFTTIFFRNIYFPSIYVYIVLLFLIDIIFSKKTRKSYKVANSIMFVLNNILFAIILNIIASNKINIFDISSLYASTDLVVVLELDMDLAILWLISVITIYTTNAITDRIRIKKELKVQDTVDNNIPQEQKEPVLETDNSNVEKKDALPDFVPEIISNSINENANTLIINNTIKDTIKDKSTVTFDDILNGTMPVTYYHKQTMEEENAEIIDPQKIYESNYQSRVSKLEQEQTSLPDNNMSFLETEKVLPKINIIKPSVKEDSITEKRETNIDYNKLEETIDKIETISDNSNMTFEKIAKEEPKENTIVGKYSIEEYKKIAEMLRKLKDHARYSNISIDEAVAISLISNYSFEDCRKFKELLENNLN